jgi:hypothetical protein
METALHTCPFCGREPGNLMMVKAFCANEECPIFDLPIDIEKWNRRATLLVTESIDGKV